MCSVKSRVGTLGGPASSMSTLRPRSAASLATQPPLAPDPTISTSYGMVCTEPTPGVDSEETLSLCLLKSLFRCLLRCSASHGATKVAPCVLLGPTYDLRASGTPRPVPVERHAEGDEAEASQRLAGRGHQRVDDQPHRHQQEQRGDEGIAERAIGPLRIRPADAVQEERGAEHGGEGEDREDGVVGERVERA